MKKKLIRTAFLLPGLMACATAMADITISEGETVMEYADNEPITVSGTGILRLTSSDPIRNTTINIEGPDATLIMEGAMCSEVKQKYLASILINGKPFNPEADRLSIRGNGSEIIPDGLLCPLTVYNEAGCTGESLQIPVDVYYRGKKLTKNKSHLEQKLLGSFDNSIRSFRLKRGYRVCFANNNDGTGFSKIFTAADRDLEVSEMPEGLEFASFVRVSRADRIGKRGICGLDVAALTRSAWYYSWGASDEPCTDFEFVPMRHNAYWDGWDKIGSRTNTSCVLGYNEPDHDDQANLTVEYAISQWDEFMKCGLRCGSPAPDSMGKEWLTKFIQAADSLNYRVDFVAVHMYWNNQTGAGLSSRITDLCRNTYGNRPMWITEWNNGANWTSEHWPDAQGTRLDADFNILPDENGKETIVKRPHTPDNSAKQCAWLQSVLEALDDNPWLERHSFFNWVEDARSVVIDNKLTPAGKIFAGFKSRPGFNPDYEYDHRWQIAPPFPSIKSYVSSAELIFTDHNGETGVNYTVQRRIDDGQWEDFAVLTAGKDYKVGKTVVIRIPYDITGRHSFRVKAKSYKGGESIWSRIVSKDIQSSGIEEVSADTFKVETAGGILYVTAAQEGKYTLYSIDGRNVRTILLPAGTRTPVNGLQRGIYILNGRKVRI